MDETSEAFIGMKDGTIAPTPFAARPRQPGAPRPRLQHEPGPRPPRPHGGGVLAPPRARRPPCRLLAPDVGAAGGPGRMGSGPRPLGAALYIASRAPDARDSEGVARKKN